MSFFAKRYKQCLKMSFKAMKPWVWAVNIIVWALPIGSYFSRRFSPRQILAGAVVGALFTLAWVLVGALIFALKDRKLYEVLDRYGFSVKYLRAYEQHRIIGKPFRLTYATEYAEIFVNIGQPVDALKYLNSIIVPPNAPVAEKVGYFFIYVLAALKSGNVQLAENMWRQYESVLASAKNSPTYNAISVFIYLALIYTDCCAGRTERAYEQTMAYLNSRDSKNSLVSVMDIKIVLLYELTVLGKTEEAAALRQTLSAEIEKHEPGFAALKNKIISDFEKASRGEVPL